jgi:transposase
MRDVEFFQKALELKEPWKVNAVRMDLAGRKVEIDIECSKQVWADPESGQRAHLHGYEERKWRHLDTMQFETILIAKVPRIKYTDGRTELLPVPWAGKHSRFTLMFESWAIQVLLASRSVKAACELLGMSWSAAHTIMQRAVERGMEGREMGELQRIGIDEKSFGKGQDYISVLTDIDEGRVLDVEPGRDKESAQRLLCTLSQEQQEAIRAVAMDMSGSFAAAVKEQMPQADIVFDRFHVTQLLNQAVDEVRRAENKKLVSEGDESLKGTKYSWLINPKNLKGARREEFEELAKRNLTTSRAWMHKENFEGFWNEPGQWHAEIYLTSWYHMAIRSRLGPIKRAARTLKGHAEGLLNYFVHWITNAVTEGLNSRIQEIKSSARGFRNFAHYRTRILFFCGKLDLRPAHNLS